MNKLDELLVCIPTYKRKWPSILACIRLNKDVNFTMFVREDDYNAGYYNESQFYLKNLKFVPIANVHELGLTREAMLQYAIQHNYKYCLQIDDSQFGLQDITCTYHWLKDILLECIKRFETDKYKDKAFAMVFPRKVKNLNELYYTDQMMQTFILNCNICKKYDLHFKSLDECGLEDMTFVIRAADKNLIELGEPRFIRIGRQGAIFGEDGGCHEENDNAATYLALNNKRAYESANYVMNDNSIKDKKFLLVKNSVLWPGTQYVKFDYKYARKKLLEENK